jgi:peptidoglycan/xylan/chitin deacetylase (PgdA/CDA1 family)
MYINRMFWILLLFEFICISQSKIIVSLNFDDGLLEHKQAAQLLTDNGMQGTFYINSGKMYQNDRLSKNEVINIYNMPHEIGGHTLDHDNLSKMSYEEQYNTICTDKSNLESALNTPIYSFAYPFGAETNDAKRITENCGYTNARDSGGLRTQSSCGGCPSSITLPVTTSNLYSIISFSYRVSMGLDVLKWQVEQVEKQFSSNPSKDYWIVFIFHEIGDFPYLPHSITWPILTDFVVWLKNKSNINILPTHSVIKGPWNAESSTTVNTGTVTTDTVNSNTVISPTTLVSPTNSPTTLTTSTKSPVSATTTLPTTTTTTSTSTTLPTTTTTTADTTNTNSGAIFAGIFVPLILLVGGVGGIVIYRKYKHSHQLPIDNDNSNGGGNSITSNKNSAPPQELSDLDDIENQWEHLNISIQPQPAILMQQESIVNQESIVQMWESTETQLPKHEVNTHIKLPTIVESTPIASIAQIAQIAQNVNGEQKKCEEELDKQFDYEIIIL